MRYGVRINGSLMATRWELRCDAVAWCRANLPTSVTWEVVQVLMM